MSTVSSNRAIYIDPPSSAYYENRLFDATNTVLNRDDTLAPYIRLWDEVKKQGGQLQTADYLVLDNTAPSSGADYYSFGILDNYKSLQAREGVTLKAFVIFEPPVVDPRLYRALPELTAAFEHVYVHNTCGEGYSLKGVNQSKLRKLYWPQPRKETIAKFWERENRLNRVVVINGNHKPHPVREELYSKRIEAMVALAKLDAVVLYGRGWGRWWSRASMWLPYWLNRSKLMSIYQGACDSKYEVLSQYKYCLCFENMAVPGYITEKIFDCFYAGTVPLYLGATDIFSLIPKAAYVDCREFSSYESMWTRVSTFSDTEVASMREAGREFLQSTEGLNYFNSLNQIFDLNSNITYGG